MASRRAWLPALVLLHALAVSVAAQPEFQPLDDWVSEHGARTRQADGVLTMQAGTIRTGRIFGDAVFRFDFRLPDPDSEGFAFVRARFGYGKSSEIGYRIALSSHGTGSHAPGRVEGRDVGITEAFRPLATPPAAGEWHQAELTMMRSAIEVRIDGVLANTVTATEFAGHLAFQAGKGRGLEVRNPAVRALATFSEPFGQGAHQLSDPGVQPPKLTHEVRPFYPRGPHDALIQGAVLLDVVIEEDGTVGDVRVTRGLHPDLDEAAVACVRQWRFTPAALSGTPIRAIASVEVSFSRRP